jgi:hypothetical protein
MASDNSSSIVADSKTLQALRAADAQTGPGAFSTQETLKSIVIVLFLVAAVAACFLTLGH